MRKVLAAILIVTTTLLMTACQVRIVKTPQAATAPDKPSTPTNSVPQPSTQPTNQQPSTPAAADGKITKTGVYFGMADSHTIEVSLDGKPTALQLPNDVLASFEALKLKKDDKVEITYSENDSKQLIVTAIRAVK